MPRGRRRKRLLVESLEPRRLLDVNGLFSGDRVVPEWFQAPAPDYPPPAAIEGAGEAAGARTVERRDTGPSDQWIVRLTPPAARAHTVADVSRLLSGAIRFETIRGLGLPGQVLVRAGGAARDIAAALAAHPQVASFAQDRVIAGQQFPDDAEFAREFGLHNTGQLGGSLDADIDAAEAWDVTTGSRAVVIAVVDSGIDLQHSELQNNLWVNADEIPNNLVDDDGNGFVDDYHGCGFDNGFDLGNGLFQCGHLADRHGHGTHVAGIIGAQGNNGEGIAGVNWQTTLMPVKFLDENNRGMTSDAIRAVNYVTMMSRRLQEAGRPAVRVINASWGFNGFDPNLRDAVARAGDAGILFVAGAGNGDVLGDGINNDVQPFYPASFDLENVVAVAATDQRDDLARFSNHGRRQVDLAAPGLGILSTEPGGRVTTRNGTSMAAAHVTGVAGLVLADVPDASVSELRAAILQGADTLANLQNTIAGGRRLNAAGALAAETFAPRSTLDPADDVLEAGGTQQQLVVTWTDREGVDVDTLDDRDLAVERVGFAASTMPAALVDVSGGTSAVTARYRVSAPGGTWDATDNGVYRVILNRGEVADVGGIKVNQRLLGTFRVDIDDPSVHFVEAVRDGIGGGTLRDAILRANARGGPDTIVLPDGVYSVELAGCCEEGGQVGDFDVTDHLHVLGGGSAHAEIHAGRVDRIFDVASGVDFALTGVTLTGGRAEVGGAIRHQGHRLTLYDTRVIDNVAVQDGGGIHSTGIATLTASTVQGNATLDTLGSGGGGIFNAGELELTTSTIAQNRTPAGFAGTGGGGGAFNAPGGILRVDRSTISGNRADNGSGGGIRNEGQLELLSSTVTANHAQVSGGGLFNSELRIVPTERQFEFGSVGPPPWFFERPDGIAVRAGTIAVADRSHHRIQVFRRDESLDISFQFLFGRFGSDIGQFNDPSDVALTADGKFLVADEENHRVQVFDAAGEPLFQFGQVGLQDGHFLFPRGVAAGGEGRMFVLDRDRVQMFNAGGKFQSGFSLKADGAAHVAEPSAIAVDHAERIYVADRNGDRVQVFDGTGALLSSFGQSGDGPGELDGPIGVDVALDGTIAVLDSGNQRVQLFASDGTFLRSVGRGGTEFGDFQLGTRGGVDLDDGLLYVTDEGSRSFHQKDASDGSTLTETGDGVFSSTSPQYRKAVAADRAGRIAVADQNFDRIQIYDEAGMLQFQFGEYGDADGQFENPRGVAFGPDGRIVVADTDNRRVQVFDDQGRFLFAFNHTGIDGEALVEPSDVAVDSQGRILVTDLETDQVHVYSKEGQHRFSFGGSGSEETQFDEPLGIAVDSADRIYVMDTGNRRVQVFNSDGSFVRQFGDFGAGEPGTLGFNTAGIEVGPEGMIYVANRSDVQVYDSSGVPRFGFGQQGSNAGNFLGIEHIAVNAAGEIYVSEDGNDRIQVFRAIEQATLGAATLANTIVADNTADGGPDAFGPDAFGRFTTGSHNLVGNADGASGFGGPVFDLLGNSVAPINPGLGELRDHGGLTWTHALRDGSAAIDTGRDERGLADQRGVARPVDASGGTVLGASSPLTPGLYDERPTERTGFAGQFVFAAPHAGAGTELLRYDPQLGQVVVVADLETTGDGADNGSSHPAHFTESEGVLYFTARAGGRRGIYAYDADPPAVRRLRELPDPAADVLEMRAIGGELYFSQIRADDPDTFQLYRYDPVADRQETLFASPRGIDSITFLNDDVYFRAIDADAGEAVFRYDPETGGTRLASDPDPESLEGRPQSLTALAGKLYFSAANQEVLRELFEYDPATDQTAVVADLCAGQCDSDPVELTVLGDKLYFVADGDDSGEALFVMDPAKASSRVSLAVDIAPSYFGADILDVTPLDGQLFFSARNGRGNADEEFINELYRYDPATDRLAIGLSAVDPAGLTLADGLLYFFGTDRFGLFETAPFGLWSYDPRQFPSAVDIGAVERYFGEIRGVQFLDRDGDGQRDLDEPGLAGWRLYADLNDNGEFDAGEPATVTRQDDPTTLFVDETGSYQLAVPPGRYTLRQQTQSGFVPTAPRQLALDTPITIARLADTDTRREGEDQRLRLEGVAPVASGSQVVFADADGHVYLAGANRPLETLLAAGQIAVPGGEGTFSSLEQPFAFNGERLTLIGHSLEDTRSGVYTLDLETRGLRAVADLQTGVPLGTGAFSGDRPFRDPEVSQNVSVFIGASESPNQQGIFASGAGGRLLRLVDLDNGPDPFSESFSEILEVELDEPAFAFLARHPEYDSSIEANVTVTGLYRGSHGTSLTKIADSDSVAPDGSGRFDDFRLVELFGGLVTFVGETETSTGIYQGRDSRSIERIVGPDTAIPGGSGNFTAFGGVAGHRGAVAWVGLGAEGQQGIYTDLTGVARQVVDRNDVLEPGKAIVEFGLAGGALTGAGLAFSARFDDGSIGVYHARFDTDIGADLEVQAGRIVGDVDFGNFGLPGEIHGQVFEDLNANGAREANEPGLAGRTVFFDQNHNQTRDPGEPSTVSDEGGRYVFAGLDSLETYFVAVETEPGFVRTLPEPPLTSHTVELLPAAREFDVDFGSRAASSGDGVGGTGRLGGRAFQDTNQNGQYDDGTDLPLAGHPVFLDFDNDARHDPIEPRTVTQSDGVYAFTDLAAGVYTVRVDPAAGVQQVAPRGNRLTASELEAVGDQPVAVATSDWDANGTVDLVVAGNETNDVTVLMNQGGGSFSHLVRLETGFQPSAIVPGDFDNDLDQDFAVTSFNSDHVQIFWNSGASPPQFSPTTISPAFNGRQGPSALTAADFDEDSLLDLAVANQFADTVSILKNNGDGTFALAATLATGDGPSDLAAGHFDLDAFLDLAVVHRGDDTLRLLPGDGQGGFALGAELAVGRRPLSIDTAHLNADGRDDLVVANVLSNNVSILVSDGDGGYRSLGAETAGRGPTSAVALDLDGDLDIDIAVTTGDPEPLAILRNRGDNTFAAAENVGVADLAVSVGFSAVAGDFDQDAIPDLALTNSFADRVVVLRNSHVAGAHRIRLADAQVAGDLDFVFLAPVTAGSWTNLDEPRDTSADGQVAPKDVLIVINEINDPQFSDANGKLPSRDPDSRAPFFDVNGDGLVTPADVLIIVNGINQAPQGEGEAGRGAASVLPAHAVHDLVFASWRRDRHAVPIRPAPAARPSLIARGQPPAPPAAADSSAVSTERTRFLRRAAPEPRRGLWETPVEWFRERPFEDNV